MILIKFARNFREKFGALLAHPLLAAARSERPASSSRSLLVAAALLEGSLNLTVRIALSRRRALVVELFAL